MRHKLFVLILITMAITTTLKARELDVSKVKIYEHVLSDVMEIIDTAELKIKLNNAEHQFQQNPSEINKVRLGIVYHETALNLAFFSKTTYKGYAKKSFEQLTELFNSPSTTPELLPFIASYRASALALVSAETKKLQLLGEAFSLFEDAVEKYARFSYLPEFLRGSVAENLPWFFFAKRRSANQDFQAIINKQTKDPEYADWKIISFTYWAWANQHQGKKYREQSLTYLEKAISLDPNYKAGRRKAEELKILFMK
ncbi:hypothetical protein I5M27_17005 [Adhaeribacter sp. BT258]|uniref:Tetratricopeptide repeat protein n=1 Tax=Adhaeribacter terrigena TaxID=2793070 RepID=A0ABS1C5N2_9BACT|nr:hypothetical protein [Adhaeribacter terrigena]MBK0404696.1 hypothetical protein [Adhaeribacter terrigena]